PALPARRRRAHAPPRRVDLGGADAGVRRPLPPGPRLPPPRRGPERAEPPEDAARAAVGAGTVDLAREPARVAARRPPGRTVRALHGLVPRQPRLAGDGDGHARVRRRAAPARVRDAGEPRERPPAR